MVRRIKTFNKNEVPEHEVIVIEKTGKFTQSILLITIFVVLVAIIIGIIIQSDILTESPTAKQSSTESVTPKAKQEEDQPKPATSSPQKKEIQTKKKPKQKKIPKAKLLKVGDKFKIYDGKQLFVIDVVYSDINKELYIKRQLKVKENVYTILTEAKVTIPEFLYTDSDTKEPFQTIDFPIDYSYVGLAYLKFILPAIYATKTLILNGTEMQDVLIVGLGGGSANNFFRHQTNNTNITVLEIEAEYLEIATKFFGYREDDRQRVIIDDGAAYIMECAEQNEKFDLIFLDACDTQPEFAVCPCGPFLNSTVAQAVSKVVKSNGAAIFNVLAFNVSDTIKSIHATYQPFFEGCVLKEIGGALNNYMVCVKRYNRLKFILSNAYHNDFLHHWIKLKIPLQP